MGNPKAANSNAPPIRFDAQFLFEWQTHLKFVEIFFNVLSAVLCWACFPNPYFEGCSFRVFTFGQLFCIVCVSAFFGVLTSILLVCRAFSLHDALWQYNFPILERLHALFAMFMYVLAIGILVCTNTASSFSTIWLCDLVVLFTTLCCYSLDYWKRLDETPPIQRQRIVV
ncbi:hypothetical protein M3Y99_01902000 [Aphelenchoides fujianensis]|nr:hypothetical protein M3Y99_01902000 [Aphelenchoides fujianensis]